jgi:hypothetical protein
MTMNRREFIKNSIAGVLMASPSAAALERALNGYDGNSSASGYLNDIDRRNASVRGEFEPEELRDISTAMSKYEAAFGHYEGGIPDLQRFAFSFGKLLPDPEKATRAIASDRKKVGYSFPGFGMRGSCDPLSRRISLAPKITVDEVNDYEVKNGLVPVGEEGYVKDYEKTTIHEMAHALGFTFLGKALYTPGWKSSKSDPEFLRAWDALDQEIKKRAEPICQINGRWENKRPHGYPTLQSKINRFSPHETFAECVTLSVAGMRDYAKSDKLLQKRIELIDNVFLEWISHNYTPFRLFTDE